MGFPEGGGGESVLGKGSYWGRGRPAPRVFWRQILDVDCRTKNCAYKGIRFEKGETPLGLLKKRAKKTEAKTLQKKKLAARAFFFVSRSSNFTPFHGFLEDVNFYQFLFFYFCSYLLFILYYLIYTRIVIF